MLLTWKKKSLASLSQWSDYDLCTRHDDPGLRIDEAALVDYSSTPATSDQRQIEDVLGRRDLRNARLLHVGVGDSGLALRLHPHCRAIDGLTVSENELRQGKTFALPNYRVWRVNKYGREMLRALQPGYDVIIDNNPASFACCAFHFSILLDNYRWALAPGGEMLTAQRGLRWVAGDRVWRMTFNDLAEAGYRFGLRATMVTDDVYSLRRE